MINKIPKFNMAFINETTKEILANNYIEVERISKKIWDDGVNIYEIKTSDELRGVDIYDILKFYPHERLLELVSDYYVRNVDITQLSIKYNLRISKLHRLLSINSFNNEDILKNRIEKYVEYSLKNGISDIGYKNILITLNEYAKRVNDVYINEVILFNKKILKLI